MNSQTQTPYQNGYWLNGIFYPVSYTPIQTPCVCPTCGTCPTCGARKHQYGTYTYAGDTYVMGT